ncbi:hypothetical protein B0T14DRAFT_603005 [Immersiella caudata]|uniref:Uncharacterized protein n=1 Tax=Immersiella caudata TaxID=314043 RepID=A0AA40BZ46_9PEZI|nr:hypothetical protein B0T14DRAFT_603005 [Immersiella caudata]
MRSSGISLISGLVAFVASTTGSLLYNTTSVPTTTSAAPWTPLSTFATASTSCGTNVTCILEHFTQRPVLAAASALAAFNSTVIHQPSSYTKAPEPVANVTSSVPVPLSTFATASTLAAFTSTVTYRPSSYTTAPEPYVNATGSVPMSPPTVTIAPTGAPVNSSIHVPMDSLHCGLFNTADTTDAKKIMKKFGDEMCITEAHTCTRHGCHNTSGVYVCNDNSWAIAMKCYLISDFGRVITDKCCSSRSTSGQFFSESAGFNVIVAYGNCNHGKSADRPSVGPPEEPWGPNGKCFN